MYNTNENKRVEKARYYTYIYKDQVFCVCISLYYYMQFITYNDEKI